MGDPLRSTKAAPPPRPRWLKALAIGAAVAVAVLIVVALLIGGDHGPGRHASGGSEGDSHTLAVQHSP
jgi:hypothetical protein